MYAAAAGVHFAVSTLFLLRVNKQGCWRAVFAVFADHELLVETPKAVLK